MQARCKPGYRPCTTRRSSIDTGKREPLTSDPSGSVTRPPRPSPHPTPGTLNICTHTLAGSVPMQNADGLPPPLPLKGSRLNAESLPKYGWLPAPKIPPGIRGATALASICGAGAAAVLERGLPLGIGWLPIWAYSPQSLRFAFQSLRRPAQPDLPAAGEILSHFSQK